MAKTHSVKEIVIGTSFNAFWAGGVGVGGGGVKELSR